MAVFVGGGIGVLDRTVGVIGWLMGVDVSVGMSVAKGVSVCGGGNVLVEIDNDSS